MKKKSQETTSTIYVAGKKQEQPNAVEVKKRTKMNDTLPDLFRMSAVETLSDFETNKH